MSHHIIALIVAVLVAAFLVFLGFVWGKSKGHSFTGSTVGVWFGGAMSAFIGGFVEAAPIGSTSGGIMAGASGHIHADLTYKHLMLEALFVLAVPFGAGIAEIRTFVKSQPFPNVFLPDSPPSIQPSAPKQPTIIT